MFKCLLIIQLSSFITGSFNLYNTNEQNNHDYKDCLYSFISNSSTMEWQLVPYCIKYNIQSYHDGDSRCYNDSDYTFEQLKLKEVDSHHLLEWHAPIDTINDYQKYLAGDALPLDNHHYCNCSANWFGTRCQYSFAQSNGVITFDEIIASQFQGRRNLQMIFQVIEDPLLLTCYEGLRCQSAICLDWRQICDGSFNCEHGEDEPDECLLLELNECGIDEYRCQSGMCIPKIFLIDFSYDCTDLTDESEIYEWRNQALFCRSFPTLMCDFRLCPQYYFSCGDGECLPVQFSWKSCSSGRDSFLLQSLLTSPNNNNGSNNITYECWFLMLCLSGDKSTQIFGYDIDTCKCSKDSPNEYQCLDHFRKHCPTSFLFQPEQNYLYPFVRFLYHNDWNNRSKWWLPTYACYNQSHCNNFPIAGVQSIDGLMCVKTKEIEQWIETPWSLNLIFSACRTAHSPMLDGDKRLFYCNKSMKFISKHRVVDSFHDCYGEEDINTHASVLRTLNLTNHFKCTGSDQWFPRPTILTFTKGQCADKSDILYIGGCKRWSDIGCQFLRGLFSSPIRYIFQENCNGFSKLIFTIDNETDETSCEEWPIFRCDGHWDTINGEDELNCSNTIPFFIETALKCNANEHYCAFRNGSMNCLSKERAGDNIADCLGFTDERRTSCAFSNLEKPFQCSDGQCVSLIFICDGFTDCFHDDDELICPWLELFTCVSYEEFSCKNKTCIGRKQWCDNVIDCQPSGEDEWLCDIKHRKTLQFSLGRIKEYPPANTDLTDLTIAAAVYPATLLPVRNTMYKYEDPLEGWYCNRGIIVVKRSSNIECLCPPSYYGQRCEYQAERLLITLRIHTPASLSGHQNQPSAIRLVARLILDEAVASYEQILHIHLMKQMFYLTYPRPPPKQRGNWSFRLDAFSVTQSNVDFRASWLFDVPFPFLPVTRLVLSLMLEDQENCNTLTCVHGKCRKFLNSPHDGYCHCEENWSGSKCNISTICQCARGGKCVVRQSLPICVCPLGRMGSDCHALFDSCIGVTCQNGGLCLPLDKRQLTSFMCSCRNGYYGDLCELARAQVDLYFSDSLYDHNSIHSAAVLVYFLDLQTDSPGILIVQNRVLYKQVQLNKLLRVFNSDREYLPTFIVLQIFFEPDNFGYYIAGIIKSPRTNISTIIHKSNRCPYVDELILNQTVREFPRMKKVKYYGHACKMSSAINWFHDEDHLCFCDEERRADCLVFQRESTQCARDYCQGNGRCVQNNFNGLWNFACVCNRCSYGSLCQLKTSQYTLSLDAMLGQDILENISLTDQPLLIKLVLVVFVMMLSLGFASNILSLMTFKQPKVQEFGCGVYLFCLPLIGQVGLSVFAGRFFYLLGTQVYNVNNRSAARWSCIGLEYLLAVCPMLFDWLTACVAVERSINIIKGASFKKPDSVWWAKRVIFLLTTVVLVSAWHEPFIRQLIEDPRATSIHTWCVITFPWSWLKYYRLVMNLINLIVPGSINLVTTVFLLHKSTRRKQTFRKKQSEQSYYTLLKKQLPLYGSPLTLVALSLMRLVFSFTLVCINYRWQKYVYLTAYFMSFAPLMCTFPIFVLPAKIYKTEFKNFLKRTRRKLRLTHII